MNYQLKEKFGEFFLQGNFKLIYENTSIIFQELVSFEQFINLSINFNKGVHCYTCIFSNSIHGFYQCVWVDEAQSKVVTIFFDDNNVIQGIYLKPFETYPMSDQTRTKNK